MTTYRKVSHLTKTDTAYIAGFIDGDGTITLSRRHKNDNRQLVVSISNTESNPLKYILECVGAGKITRKRASQENHTPSLTYSISNRQALDLLSQITPYFKTYKKLRAQLVLDKYVELTPRNGKYTDSMREDRKQFIRQFFQFQPGDLK